MRSGKKKTENKFDLIHNYHTFVGLLRYLIEMEIMGTALKKEYEVILEAYDLHNREVMGRLCNMKRIRRAKKINDIKTMLKTKLKYKQ
jgi:hypothetical protein